MKKIALASFLALTFGFAQAENVSNNVEIYGRIDTAIEVSNNVGTPNGNATAIVGNGDYASFFGVKGKEDLGGGTYSGFDVEAGFTPNDGQSMGNGVAQANSPSFNRATNVFIGNESWGQVKLGRQENQFERAWQNYGEVRSGSNFGTGITFWDDSSSFGGTATSKSGLSSYTGGYFLGNAIQYNTPKIAGLQGNLTYVAGGASGDGTLGNVDASNKTLADITFNYGPFGAAVGYSKFDGSNGQANGQTTYVVGNYTYDKFKIAGGLTNFQNPNAAAGTANSNFDMQMISAKYEVTPQTDIAVGYYAIEDKVNTGNKAQQVSLYANYKLSKRTYVWAGVASVNNNGNMGFGSTSAGSGNANINSTNGAIASLPTVAGQVQTTYASGISYIF